METRKLHSVQEASVSGTRSNLARCTVPIAIVIALCTVVMPGCDQGSSSTDGGPTNPPMQPSRAPVTVGCYSSTYAGFGQSQIGCGLINSFGDPGFDNRFSQEIAIQGAFWQGLPTTVYAFDECGPANALSFPQGYILFGLNMARNAIRTTGSELPIAGVLAHEFAHQAQFDFGWQNPNASTRRSTELEADAFSGYYMALAKGWAGPQMESFFLFLFNSGDFNFHDTNHHGTPQERLAAGALGLEAGFQAIALGRGFSYQQLHAFFSSVIGSSNITPARVVSDTLGIEPGQVRIDLDLVAGVESGMRSLNELHFPAGIAAIPRPDLSPR